MDAEWATEIEAGAAAAAAPSRTTSSRRSPVDRLPSHLVGSARRGSSTSDSAGERGTVPEEEGGVGLLPDRPRMIFKLAELYRHEIISLGATLKVTYAR